MPKPCRNPDAREAKELRFDHARHHLTAIGANVIAHAAPKAPQERRTRTTTDLPMAGSGDAPSRAAHAAVEPHVREHSIPPVRAVRERARQAGSAADLARSVVVRRSDRPAPLLGLIRAHGVDRRDVPRFARTVGSSGPTTDERPCRNRAARRDPRRMNSAELSHDLFDAFCRRDLDAMVSMMADDVRYELANAPTLTSRDAVRDMYTSLFEALGDAEIKLLEFIAHGNKAALILSLPGSDEVGGSVFHEWSDDGLLLRYQSFSRV